MTTYAVNRKTKEHRIAKPGESWAHPWQLLSADKDGWVEWFGGECPLPGGATHQIKMRGDGESPVDDTPESWRWDYYGRGDDIIAYRPILDADTKPEPPAWDGEGAPPVGARCMMQSPILGMWANEWLEVEVIARRNTVAIGWCDEKQIAIWSGMLACRPIRSEEDRAVDTMECTYLRGDSIGGRPAAMREVYRAIRDGKIPGVRLDD